MLYWTELNVKMFVPAVMLYSVLGTLALTRSTRTTLCKGAVKCKVYASPDGYRAVSRLDEST
jgi:hypothetical protein